MLHKYKIIQERGGGVLFCGRGEGTKSTDICHLDLMKEWQPLREMCIELSIW